MVFAVLSNVATAFFAPSTLAPRVDARAAVRAQIKVSDQSSQHNG